jgi:hypothetical protein
MGIGGRSRGACVCSRLHGFRCAHQTRSANPSETPTRHHFCTTSLHLLSDLLHHFTFSLSVRRCISTSINNADITLRSWIPTPEPPSRYEWIDLPHLPEPFIGLHLPGAALALRNDSSVPEDRDRVLSLNFPQREKYAPRPTVLSSQKTMPRRHHTLVPVPCTVRVFWPHYKGNGGNMSAISTATPLVTL